MLSGRRLIRNNLDSVLLSGFLAILAIASCLFIYGSRLNNPPIRSDGFGYYAYLPSVFIDHSLSLRPALEDAGQTAYVYGIGVDNSTGRVFDKYSLGTAMLETPFFLVADTYTRLTGGRRTGYSQPYQVAVVASGIFYLCAGSLLLYITLRRLFGKPVAALTTLAVVFATNVFHYGTYDNSYSQIYSYAAIALFVYLLLTIDLRKTDHRRYIWLIAIGLCLGIITSIRVPDAVVALLLLPLLLKNNTVRSFVKDGSLVGASCLIALTPMLFYLWHATGSVFTNSYHVLPLPNNQYEGFTNLRRPEIINFSFSVRKGLFFWSPILSVAVASLGALIKRTGGFGIAVVLVLCLDIYICASWWLWSFGGGFGSRPFVDMMPLMGLALAAGVGYLSKRMSMKLVWVLPIMLMLLNIALMYSYWRGYIAFDNMTWHKLTLVPRDLWQGL
jgi:Dolichyl-phosphate-mannose-protein mannosyltransferase